MPLATPSSSSSSTSSPVRVAVVTGGNKGIGYEIARNLGSLKKVVCVLAARSPDRGQAAAEALKKDG